MRHDDKPVGFHGCLILVGAILGDSIVEKRCSEGRKAADYDRSFDQGNGPLFRWRLYLLKSTLEILGSLNLWQNGATTTKQYRTATPLFLSRYRLRNAHSANSRRPRIPQA